jgi:hypothetical protein
MNKKALFFITAIIITVSVIFYYRYQSIRCGEVTYAVERYMTTGIFNRHKLYKVDNYTLIFSDGSAAIVKVQGIEKKPPHRRVSYNVIMEKNKFGTWKKRRVYATTYVTKSGE